MLIYSEALPQPADPNIADFYEYSGEIAQYAQNIQCDDRGKLLFFIIDGKIYNYDGMLIADPEFGLNGQSVPSGAPPTCQACTYSGRNQIGIIPVPGSCTRFFIFSSGYSSSTIGSTAFLRMGVLDMSLDNDLAYYLAAGIKVKGRFMNYYEDPAYGSDFDLFDAATVGMPTSEIGGGGALYAAEYELDAMAFLFEDGLRFDVQQIDGTDFFVLSVVAPENLFFIRIDARGPRLLLKLPRTYGSSNGQTVLFDTRDDDKTFRSEITTKQVGNTLYVGHSVYYYLTPSLDTTPPLALFDHKLGVWVYEIDLTNVGQLQPSVSFNYQNNFNPRLYGLDWFPGNDIQFDALGNALTAPRVGGLEFSPNGQFLYFVKSTHLPDPLQPSQPESNLGYIDVLAVPPVVYQFLAIGPPAFTAKLVDTQLETARIPGSSNDALVMLGKDGGGQNWLGAFLNPDQPDPLNWDGSQINLVNVSKRLNSGDPVEYRLLCDRIDGFDYVAHFDPNVCCADIVSMKDRSRTISGTDNWAPGDNPFVNTTDPVFISTELRFQAGSSIVANNMDFRFGQGATLIIEPGATFRCNNCTFRNACDYERWNGIEVWGNSNRHQTYPGTVQYQGRLRLYDCQVTNAEIGVLLSKRGGTGYNKLMNGGEVLCNGTTFLNCKQGVKFPAYQNYKPSTLAPMRNLSRFTNTTFTVDDYYQGVYDFKEHAWLWKVDGLQFNGCIFQNLRTSLASTGSSTLGYGINSLDANYRVNATCNTIPPLGQLCPDADANPSVFKGLDHGIHARVATTSRNFTVARSRFENNICGVYAEGVPGFEATRNTFVMGARLAVLDNGNENFWEDFHRGVYSAGSYGFRVDDNAFSMANNPVASAEGIVIGYNRDHNDVVFRNTATGMGRAYIGEGVCAEVYNGGSNYLGLQFWCNQNTNNAQNFWDRKVSQDQSEQSFHTIRTIQGALNRPAGNSFDQDQGLPPFSDLFRTSTNGVLNYLFDPLVPTANPVDYNAPLVAAPTASTSTPVALCSENPYEVLGGNDPTNPHIAQWTCELNTAKLAYGSVRYVYDQLIDGGSTDAVVQEIQETWPSEAWALRNSLLEASPFLSTEALMKMAEQGVLPPAMVLEVCQANPEGTQGEGFLSWLELSCPYPLPAYMLDLIAASWQTKTYRFTLEAQLATHHATFSQRFNLLNQAWQADSTEEHTPELLALWEQLPTTAGVYGKALTHLQRGEYVQALDVLNTLQDNFRLRGPQLDERDRMASAIGVLANAALGGRSEAELSPTEVNTLELESEGASDRAATWIHNLLCFHYGICDPLPTGGDGGGLRSLTALASGETGLPSLSVAPNPADPFVSATYSFPLEGGNVDFTVTDVGGRLIKRLTLQEGRGQTAIDTRSLAPGPYQLTAACGGSVLHTTFIIQR